MPVTIPPIVGTLGVQFDPQPLKIDLTGFDTENIHTVIDLNIPALSLLETFQPTVDINLGGIEIPQDITITHKIETSMLWILLIVAIILSLTIIYAVRTIVGSRRKFSNI